MIRLAVLATVLAAGEIVDVVTPSSISPWLEAAKFFGPVVALVWYLYHNQSITTPQLHQSYQKSLNDQQIVFTNTLDRIVERFDRSLEAERKARADELASIREHFECRANK